MMSLPLSSYYNNLDMDSGREDGENSISSHDQCNIRLEKGGMELVWISYGFKRGFHSKILRDFTYTIK